MRTYVVRRVVAYYWHTIGTYHAQHTHEGMQPGPSWYQPGTSLDCLDCLGAKHSQPTGATLRDPGRREAPRRVHVPPAPAAARRGGASAPRNRQTRPKRETQKLQRQFAKRGGGGNSRSSRASYYRQRASFVLKEADDVPFHRY